MILPDMQGRAPFPLRPSSIEGLIALRAEMERGVHVHAADAITLLSRTYAYAFDFDPAVAYFSDIPTLSGDRETQYQQVISWYVHAHRPWWLSRLCGGRKAIAEFDEDLSTCFERAGVSQLSMSLPGAEWLDGLVSAAFSQRDQAQLAFGRRAEAMAFSYECQSLSQFDDAPMPTWVALDDNAKGFDIESSSPTSMGFVPRYVEVKALSSRTGTIFITRHEWNTCERLRDYYVFQLWIPDQALMTELSFQDLRPHMPTDSGDGRWETTTLSLGSLGLRWQAYAHPTSLDGEIPPSPTGE